MSYNNHMEHPPAPYRSIVQLVERRSPKPDVVGSNPTAPVMLKKILARLFSNWGSVDYLTILPTK